MSDRVVCAFLEAADFAGNALYYTVNQGERFVFAERDQVNFVVGENVLALRIGQDGAVVRDEAVMSLRVGGLTPVDGACQERAMKPNGERRGNLRELRILERKWRRSFGPDQQVGLASVRRETEIFDFV